VTSQTPQTSRRLEAAWLREGALAALLAALDCDGEEARVVGGAVRNALIDEPVGEIDIATTALPQQVTQRAQAAGFKAVPTGIAHGTVTVVVDGRPFEVTTLREDVETDGRHAKVVFGRDWRRDAERRDFTMNALFLSRDGMIHDYVDGLADLAARRVRFIGAPERRIAEDYLRILRFFRFHAAYGKGAPDAAGLAACINAREGLASLSRERVRMEIFKLIAAQGVVAALEVMTDAGLLDRVLGGVPVVAHLGNMVALEATLAIAPDPVLRLGALAVLVVEDAERLRERLRLTNAEYERLHAMADGWWQMSPTLDETAARALLYHVGPQTFADRALLAWSRAPQSNAEPPWQALASLPQRWQAPKFPLKAADLIARGVEKGPALGAALKAAEAAWVRADFPHDPLVLEDIANSAARPLQS
jgi:poly(A) polymerase